MWESVERSEGKYNDTYLDEIEKVINRLGEKGIYTMVDAHQDVLARIICGEGMPNFYAKKVLKNEDNYCFGKYFDFYFRWFYDMFGVCSSMKNLELRYEANGNPMIKDCQKYNFGSFYGSPESVTLFRSIYNNNHGM